MAGRAKTQAIAFLDLFSFSAKRGMIKPEEEKGTEERGRKKLSNSLLCLPNKILLTELVSVIGHKNTADLTNPLHVDGHIMKMIYWHACTMRPIASA